MGRAHRLPCGRVQAERGEVREEEGPGAAVFLLLGAAAVDVCAAQAVRVGREDVAGPVGQVEVGGV